MADINRQRARRLPAQERRAAILLTAASFFAAEGFSASTRDLGESMGIRQALLYKYFTSKEAQLLLVAKTILSQPSTL
jgi:AcrR family transcriptional regulator